MLNLRFQALVITDYMFIRLHPVLFHWYIILILLLHIMDYNEPFIGKFIYPQLSILRRILYAFTTAPTSLKNQA